MLTRSNILLESPEFHNYRLNYLLQCYLWLHRILKESHKHYSDCRIVTCLAPGDMEAWFTKTTLISGSYFLPCTISHLQMMLLLTKRNTRKSVGKAQGYSWKHKLKPSILCKKHSLKVNTWIFLKKLFDLWLRRSSNTRSGKARSGKWWHHWCIP